LEFRVIINKDRDRYGYLVEGYFASRAGHKGIKAARRNMMYGSPLRAKLDGVTLKK
jgi:hypothetical protein